jgi:hypothetical protein
MIFFKKAVSNLKSSIQKDELNKVGVKAPERKVFSLEVPNVEENSNPRE